MRFLILLFIITTSFLGHSQVVTTYPNNPSVAIEPLNFELIPDLSGNDLNIPTYDANPNCTHPSVVYFSSGWNGYKYWMGFTPYPAEARENPSIVQSNDGVTWTVPSGLTNPITPSPGGGSAAPYLSDIDLVYNPDDNKLYAFYRWSDATSEDRFYYKTSSDGSTWSSELLVASGLSFFSAAPSFVHKDGYWWLWYTTNNGTASNATPYPMRFRKAKTISGLATAPEVTCTIINDDGTRHNWHDEIRWDATLNQFVGFFCYTSLAYPTAPNNDGVVYWGTSNDGVTWYLSPPYPNMMAGESNVASYRSTFVRSDYASQNGAEFELFYTYKWKIKRGLAFRKSTNRTKGIFDNQSSIEAIYGFLCRTQNWVGLPVARLYRNSDGALRDVFPSSAGALKLADSTDVATFCSGGCGVDRVYNQTGSNDYLYPVTTRPALTSTPWTGTSKWGISFNGTSDVLQSRQNHTIQGVTMAAYIASGRAATVVSGSIYFGMNGQNITLLNTGSIGAFYKPNASTLTGIWGGSNSSYIRVNGVTQVRGSTTAPAANNQIALGAHYATSSYSSFMSGVICEAAFWNNFPRSTALSTVETQMTTDYPFTPTVVVYDTFTDTDNTNLNSHTADIRPGSNAYSSTDGDFKISSNKLTRIAAGSNPSTGTIDSGVSDGIIELDVNPAGTGGCGMVLRYTTDNDFTYVRLFNNVTLSINKYVSGSFSTIQSATITAPGKPFTLKVEMIGSTLRVYCNNVMYFSTTSTSGQTNTKVGMIYTGEGNTTTWDNLKVTRWN